MFCRALPRLTNHYSSLKSLLIVSERSASYAGRVQGVKKVGPMDVQLADYAKYIWDDTVTEDDPVVKRLREQILSGSRAALASSITLVESRNPKKRAQGNILLQGILAAERKRYEEKGKEAMIYRIGISGSPGVGKSSFIEALGRELTEDRGMKIAVLTIDPSSAVTGGSLLGDLTRMQELSRNPMAFIRQSPTSGSLGGVARGIHEAVILCEGAGYDVVVIETVGVGQSEIAVSDMCDLFCLLLSPAHGDELQGVKRGIMELSDLLVVTKDDGELRSKARLTQAEYISALKYLRPRLDVWKPKVLRSSIRDPKSVKDVADVMFEYWQTILKSGDLERRRTEQMTQWMWNHVQDELLKVFKAHPKVAPLAPSLESDVRLGKITPGLASESLIRKFLNV